MFFNIGKLSLPLPIPTIFSTAEIPSLKFVLITTTFILLINYIIVMVTIKERKTGDKLKKMFILTAFFSPARGGKHGH